MGRKGRLVGGEGRGHISPTAPVHHRLPGRAQAGRPVRTPRVSRPGAPRRYPLADGRVFGHTHTPATRKLQLSSESAPSGAAAAALRHPPPAALREHPNRLGPAPRPPGPLASPLLIAPRLPSRPGGDIQRLEKDFDFQILFFF